MDNNEFKRQLEDRTLKFGIETTDFCLRLVELGTPNVLINQFLKAGTSIGANYREANRAESKKDFIHKIGIVEKEASESVYWLKVFQGSKKLRFQQEDIPVLNFLSKEADEFLALFNSISRNSKK